MKLTLVLIQSANGFIAKDQDDGLDWGSKADKKFFKDITTQIGMMIMGSTTYKKMPPVVFDSRPALVLTLDPEKYTAHQNVEFFKGSAAEAIKHLEDKGINEAALIGGGNVNAQFLAAGLIDELYLTIAPHIFAGGVKSFSDGIGEANLKLLDSKQIEGDEILLHYQVIK